MEQTTQKLTTEKTTKETVLLLPSKTSTKSKAHPISTFKRKLLMFTSAAIGLMLLIYIFTNLYGQFVKQKYSRNSTYNSKSNEKIIIKAVPTDNQMYPVRLMIPKINVNAAIEYVSLTSKGEMGAPRNSFDVGWFALGTIPGEKGSAVIDGHVDGQVDGQDNIAGVFANLRNLNKGDKLYVQNGRGATITFVVRDKRTYNPGYESGVFSGSDSAHLNLITCYGAWNKTKKSYDKRLVVFSDIAS